MIGEHHFLLQIAMTSLEAKFHEAMLDVYKSALKECKYRATAFLGMVIDMNGVQAAKKLLSTSVMQSGLYELFDCGRLDLTVETLVLQPEYQELFTLQELAEAKRRIEELQSRSR